MHFFDEIKEYIGFTAEDVERLRELLPVVEPHFTPIVDKFYDALMKNPRARGVFTGPEQVQRLRRTLHVWLKETFEGPYDNHYFERRQRIGEVHVNVGLLPHFMFGAMNLIRIELINIVSQYKGCHDGSAYVRAVERIVDIELTLMLQSYWNTHMKLKLQMPAAMATALAHEIRNPINAIGLQMTLLERKLRNADVDSDIYSPVLDAVRSELRRIQGLNSEIMDFAKPIELAPSWHDANVLIADLQNAHGPTLDAANIRLTSRITGSPKVWCDADRLNQVLVNLLTNAVEAMDESGELDIHFTTTDSGTVIDFRDNGAGMPPSLKYRIFDLFFTTRAAGTGIGLPLARKIIEAHGGSIDVISRPGVGTQFTIYLPRPLESEEVDR